MIRGHNVFAGYLDNPEATAEAIVDGWFRTGDIGTRDADGFISIVDRKKDLIIRGGFNVYPREVEEVLARHPAVAQVAVIGVPDDRVGEEVCAVVVAAAPIDGRRAARLVARAPRPAQVPAPGRGHRRAPDGAVAQGAQARAAQPLLSQATRRRRVRSTQVRLARRPHGEPGDDCFEITHDEVPSPGRRRAAAARRATCRSTRTCAAG